MPTPCWKIHLTTICRLKKQIHKKSLPCTVIAPPERQHVPYEAAPFKGKNHSVVEASKPSTCTLLEFESNYFSNTILILPKAQTSGEDAVEFQMHMEPLKPELSKRCSMDGGPKDQNVAICRDVGNGWVGKRKIAWQDQIAWISGEKDVVDELPEFEHVVGLQGDGHGEAAVRCGAGQHEGEALVGDAAGPHEHRPPPPEVGIVDGQAHPAGKPDVGAPERVRAPHQRRQVRLHLQVVQRRSHVCIVHPRQRLLDRPRRRGRPTPRRRHLPGCRHRRGREYHVPEVALGGWRHQPLPTVGRDVHLGRLIGREVTGHARAPPHMGGEEGVPPGGALALRRFSWARVSLKMLTATDPSLAGLTEGGEVGGVEGAVFKGGAGWYSTWGKDGVGGSRARRRVRSMKGCTRTPTPRAMSDQELMKWRPEKPSATWCCIPTPSDTPPHLKYVTCIRNILLHHTVPLTALVDMKQSKENHDVGKYQKRERGDVVGVVHLGDQLLQLHGGREVAEVVHRRVGVGLHEEHPLAIAVDLDPAVLVPGQPPGHRVEGHQRPGQRLPHHRRVEEARRPVRPVEVHARRVEPRHHQIQVRVPQTPPLRRLRRPHHRRPPHVDHHHRSPAVLKLPTAASNTVVDRIEITEPFDSHRQRRMISPLVKSLNV
ncbi:unnamed protein product [Musa acuminata subsp. burmannicoides]